MYEDSGFRDPHFVQTCHGSPTQKLQPLPLLQTSLDFSRVGNKGLYEKEIT